MDHEPKGMNSIHAHAVPGFFPLRLKWDMEMERNTGRWVEKTKAYVFAPNMNLYFLQPIWH
jgi:hypothetical protein